MEPVEVLSRSDDHIIPPNHLHESISTCLLVWRLYNPYRLKHGRTHEQDTPVHPKIILQVLHDDNDALLWRVLHNRLRKRR